MLAKCHGRKNDTNDGCAGKVNIAEKPVSRDYRSFAASTFGTVAFKMLEWLTPQGLQAISEQISEASEPDSPCKQQHVKKTERNIVEESPATPDKAVPSLTRSSSKSSQSLPTPEPEQSHQPLPEPTARPDESILARDPARRKRNSKGSVKTATASKPQKKTSLEPLPPPAPADSQKITAKSNSFHGEKRPRPPKLTPGVMGRTVPEIPLKPAFFENVPCLSPPPVDEVDPGSSEHGDSDEDPSTRNTIAVTRTRRQKQQSEDQNDTLLESDESWKNYPLPQSLNQLNVELIDFICDVFQEDRTDEKQFFGPLTLTESHPKPHNRSKSLSRKANHSAKTAVISSRKWQAFNEQTIFNVMSDPHSLVKSFTKDGKLYDSQTLWYCMLRMTRVAPTLVLHSLWLAAKSLFVPPEALNSSRLPSKKLFGDRPKGALSNFEAGCVMSICLHALVAAAPCAADSKTLYEMSRIRSNGLVLAGQGAAARQPSSVCLEYDDIFSNELTLRLARRLFCAITARKCFAEIAEWDGGAEDAIGIDVLGLLLNQLDLVGSGPIRILDFTQAERLLHETRVPTLLLDWARAVLLQEWNGRPEYTNDSPFHGAMSLIATLCK